MFGLELSEKQGGHRRPAAFSLAILSTAMTLPPAISTAIIGLIIIISRRPGPGVMA